MQPQMAAPALSFIFLAAYLIGVVALTVFMVWLAYRFVRAVERIADRFDAVGISIHPGDAEPPLV